MKAVKKSTPTSLPFFMVSSADKISGLTGLNPIVTISKGLGSFVVPEGNVSEIGNGFYKLNATANDLNTQGFMILHAEAPGAIPTDEYFLVVNFDPFNPDNLGLLYLDDKITLIPNKVWSENQTSYSSMTGTFGYYLDDKVSNMTSGIQVIVSPINANIMDPVGSGGKLTIYTNNRIRATWNLSTDITGSLPRFIAYSVLDVAQILMNIPSNYFTIQQQTNGSILRLDAPDSYIPNITGTERSLHYIIKDDASDAVLLYGDVVIKVSPA